MTYTFDYFVGKLRCPECGIVSRADESTNMQTKICRVPKMAPYAEGAVLEFDLGDIEAGGYILIQPPRDSESLILLESWECPSCGAPFNWAKISIKNKTIEVVESINLDESVIKKSNYISEDCGYLGWKITDKEVKQEKI